MKKAQAPKLLPEILKKGIGPILVVLCIAGLYIIYKVKLRKYVTDEWHLLVVKWTSTVVVFTVGVWLQKGISSGVRWYAETIAVRTRTMLDDKFMPLLQKVAQVILWIIVVLVILKIFGRDVNTILAALGVGSLAIALAAQDTIANIIAGFLIMLDRPFRIGDRITLPTGEKVDVLDIGIRRSKFLSEDGAIIIVPNLDLSKSKIVNFTYGEERKKGSQKGKT
jgi:small-conductance mechanosensitive channel